MEDAAGLNDLFQVGQTMKNIIYLQKQTKNHKKPLKPRENLLFMSSTVSFLEKMFLSSILS
jgi:hypothetical protein